MKILPSPSARRKIALAAARLAARPSGPPSPGQPGSGLQALIARLRTDCTAFIDGYCIIDDTQGHGDGSGTMPFRLWESQKDLIRVIVSERLVIILKARQLGISWAVCAYALWLSVLFPGKQILLFSLGEDEASELLRRVQVLYERLPEELKEALPALEKDNTGLLVWSNGSRIRSMPATQRAGRSLTASVVIMDEAAHMMWADKLYTAAKPTMDGGGQLIIVSTANGLGNLFHALWVRAVAGLNKFRTVFLPWWSRPGRDEAWYAERVTEESDPLRIKQEYPANATEAFLATGRLRFPVEWIEGQAKNVRSGTPPLGWPESLRHLSGLILYAFPGVQPCILAADVAEGLEGGDYSAAVLLDRESGEEMASLHGHWEPDEFARHLAALGRAFGDCAIIVERNNHGHAVLATLRNGMGDRMEPYGNIGEGLDKRQGWLSNVHTKPHSIDLLATALRDGTITVHSQAALDEFQVYKVLKDGKTGASDGYHDDRVMAWAIGLAYIHLLGQPGLLMTGGDRATLAGHPDLVPSTAPSLPPPTWATHRGIPGAIS
jgi:hypothetical protein